MNINYAGLRLIERFEGFRDTAYLCPAGVPTIGYGTTRGVRLGQTITEQEARGMLTRDVVEAEQAILAAVKVPMTPDQFSALCSFVYNVGIGAFRQSTLLKLLNKGDRIGAADQLLRWNMSKGKVLAGLTRRREAERSLFLGIPQPMGLLSPVLDEALGKVIVDIVAPTLMELLVTWLTGLLKR
ncbi:lysozyme [Teichococcus vastitatis]|uniref:lysozyme n=1 Tax=Teichococcus vastitatis TaxID=2307076 RepID=UPI000E70811C|nr:lysozyme [Pseudoroseomonas vastitatis]